MDKTGKVVLLNTGAVVAGVLAGMQALVSLPRPSGVWTYASFAVQVLLALAVVWAWRTDRHYLMALPLGLLLACYYGLAV